MGRLPFNMARLSRVQTEGAARQGGRESALTVAALAARISEGIREAMPQTVRVAGELSGLTDRTHLYFDLKDETAVVNCVMFASAARRSRYQPRSGQQVVVTGRVEFHSKSGRVSILVDRVEPLGLGAAEQAFRDLFEEIKGLGWFEPAHKRPLPIDPRRVAVVTSSAGAALQDVLDTMRRRCPSVEIATVDVRVQGERAVGEIVQAIQKLSAKRVEFGLDAIILTRGGGSKEDLAAFNDRRVAEAVYKCKLPLVAAIGHETDTSIAELVADERAATPTQAAMRLSPDSAALVEQLDATQGRLEVSVRRRFDEGRSSFDWSTKHLVSVMGRRLHETSAQTERAAARMVSHQPAAVLARRSEHLRSARMRLVATMRRPIADGVVQSDSSQLQLVMRHKLETAAVSLAGAEARLAAVNPTAVLERGFSITTLKDGTIVRHKAQADPGTRVVTRVADGAFDSTVDGRADEARNQTPASPACSKRSRRNQTKANPGDQGMDLFGSSG